LRANTRIAFLSSVLLLALALAVLTPPSLHALQTADLAAFSAAEAAEKAASELNHQIAGFALIAIAALIIAGLSSQTSRLRFVWPFLFIAMGLFLAAWSDAEIWPRGPLPWTWMIGHDAEARQHKIYALLLIAMGLIEFLGARGKLTLRWQTWSFPVLAVCGAALLTMHSHGGTSGLPPGWQPSQGVPTSRPVGPIVAVLEPVAMQDSASQDATHGHHHHGQSMPVAAAETPATPSGHQEHHQMTPEMLRIQRQHLWMTIVGIAVASFKFLADGRFLRNRAVPYLWPAAMAVLGVLLLFYRE
jgi:hypothetical protein